MSTITLLGETEASFRGSVLSLSGNAMHLYVRGTIPVGGLLKVETGQCMYLGEVAATWPRPESGYTAALMLVEHSLPSRFRFAPEEALKRPAA